MAALLPFSPCPHERRNVDVWLLPLIEHLWRFFWSVYSLMLFWLKSFWNKWIIDTLACFKQSAPIENVRWERFPLKVTFSVPPDSKITPCVFGMYTSTGRSESSINDRTRTADSDCVDGVCVCGGEGSVPLTDQLLFFQGHSSKMVVLNFRLKKRIKKDPHPDT